MLRNQKLLQQYNSMRNNNSANTASSKKSKIKKLKTAKAGALNIGTAILDQQPTDSKIKDKNNFALEGLSTK